VAAPGVLERARMRVHVAMGHRQVGPGNTVSGRQFKWYFEQIPTSNVSNEFQTVSDFGRLEKYFLRLKNIEIKYGFEDLVEMNKFLARNFLRFGMNLEFKFREVSMSSNQGIFD
jgi:hypothetical protein